MTATNKFRDAIRAGRVSIILTYQTNDDAPITIVRPVIQTALENYNGGTPGDGSTIYLLRLWPDGPSGEVRAAISLADYQRAKNDPTLLNGLDVDQFRMRGPKILAHHLSITEVRA